jgi:glycopeptide antibiotics resistance protein
VPGRDLHQLPRPWTVAARIALAGYLVLPALLTLAPVRPETGERFFTRALGWVVGLLTFGRAEISSEEVEVFANVLLLMPLGFLLVLALPRLPLSLLLVGAALLSLCIEIVQFVVLPERMASLVDVLANSGGAAIGIVLGTDLRRLLERPPRPRDRS